MNTPMDDKQIRIQNWLVRARNALHDANFLFQKDDHYSGVVDRAYYSMLYAVFALLVPLNRKWKMDGDEKIIALFDEKFIKQNILPSHMSKTLHDATCMHRADEFQDFFVVSKEQASDILNSSVEFLKAIERKLLEKLE